MANEPERMAPAGFDLNPEDDGQPEGPSEVVRHGGCLCGAVRYEARGAPVLVGFCHCEDCHRESGSLGLFWGDWPRAALRMTGPLATFGGRSFCPACGSRVAHLGPHDVGLMIGTMDDPPTDLTPTSEIWTIRREPWMAPVPGAAQHERDAG